jgi:hypothetical protein
MKPDDIFADEMATVGIDAETLKAINTCMGTYAMGRNRPQITNPQITNVSSSTVITGGGYVVTGGGGYMSGGGYGGGGIGTTTNLGTGQWQSGNASAWGTNAMTFYEADYYGDPEMVTLRETLEERNEEIADFRVELAEAQAEILALEREIEMLEAEREE